MSTPDFTGSGRPRRRESDPADYGRGTGDGYSRSDDERYGLRNQASRQDATGYGGGNGYESGNGGRNGTAREDEYGRRESTGHRRNNGLRDNYGRQSPDESSYSHQARNGGQARNSDGRRGGAGRRDTSARGYDPAGEAGQAGSGYGRQAAGGRAGSDERGYSRRAGAASGDGYGRSDGYGDGDYRPARGYRPDGGAERRPGSGRGDGRRNGTRPGSRRPLRGRRAEYGAGDDGNGGGRGGKPPKRKGSWWRHWSWKKAIAVVSVACGAVVVLAAILIGVGYASTPIPSAVSAVALQQASTVYFSDGKTVVGTFGTIDRQVLNFNQIPPQLANAVLAAEDRNFYSEGGVSPTGIVRAAVSDVTGSGDALQGGSTITQQFVRNYYADIGTEQTISRKIREIFVSVKLARVKSKDWILTQYLNMIYFGNGAYGIEAAAETYFGKPVGQLDVAQDAVIASMLNAPGQFDPTPGTAGYNPLVARWHYVLQGMVTMGKLTQQQASAQTFPKVVSARPVASGYTGYNGYIMQAVENELENTYHYTQSKIDNGGLHIVTTFSKPMMDELYATVSENEKQMTADGKSLPWYAHVGAVLEQPTTGAIVAMYSGPSYSESAAYCQKIDCNEDMALQNREQVGSSFKPYVLATARTQGMSVKTSVLDGTSPLCVPSDQYPDQYSVPATGLGQAGCPTTPYGWHAFSNDAGDSGAGGPQSVVYSTAQSLNTAYTDLTHRVGTQNVINMAKNFGVNTGPYLSGGSGLQNMVGQVGIALGTAALTVEEQANLFATLANGGEYNSPHVIQQITQGTTLVASRIEHHQVLTPDVNSDVDYALSFDTTEGTGTNAAMSDGRPIIGKTGTTNTAQSAFFLGAIPQYSLAIGMFTDNQNASTAANAQTLTGIGDLGGYGGDWPAIIWHSFAEKEFAQLPIEDFPTPDFGGTSWNLIGQTQQQRPVTQPTTHPTPHPTSSCTPSLRPGCGSTTPPPTSPPPTSPPPCKGGIRCGTGKPTPPPLAPQGGNDGGGGGSGGGNTSGTARMLAADPPTTPAWVAGDRRR